ncbi:MAG: S46 family peptidase [Crocinitomicaceae bacterium]
MKQIKITLVALAVFIGTFAKADEGMWLPFLLGRNYEDMKKHGLRLTQEEIYSLNKSSLKDAVISFGGFCTGEIISNQGLILTNHHCGYDAIAGASTPEHNYLDNGFWAKNHQEEIAVPGLTATFIIRIEDVTATIAKELNENMSPEERAAKIKELSAVLTKDAVNGTHYEAFVRDFYEGNEFYLFVKETFKDIRFVGTPPQSAGKYGGDTDNWMWPRHTADFSMFRIYSGADNKPAGFNADNVPYSPKHHLPVNIKGVKENDYAMIMGFPGSTDRYLCSWGVEQAVTLDQPKRVDIRAKKLDIMKSYMNKDVALRLKYSSKYAQVANYWKYFIGQTEQVTNNGVIGKKQALEAKFAEFAKGNPVYEPVLGLFENAYKAKADYVYIKDYQSEFLYTVDLMLLTFRYKFFLDPLKAGNADAAKMMAGRLQGIGAETFDKINIDLELETIESLLRMYINDIPKSQQGKMIRKMRLFRERKIRNFMESVRSTSIFADKARYEAFAADPTQEVLEKDPLFKLAMDINDAFTKVQELEAVKTADANLEKAERLYVKGLREMQPEKKFYPNANSTMRLTYGNVLPYTTPKGVHYDITTSYEGLLAKEDPNNPEFNIDPIMKQKMLAKDFGQYADENGDLKINFLSNNDITGGNSGSPVINAEGHLIGTAFDGNWEAMSGDIFFEPNIQRTISLDVRYTLWLIDKCYGAGHIVDEMTLIK